MTATMYRRITLALLALALSAAAPPPVAGEVVLLSGRGSACPPEHLGPGALVLRLDGAELPAALARAARLELDSDAPALERGTLGRVEEASAVHLVGGSGLAWWQVLTTRGKRSGLQRALHAARARGAALVGWGAGAAALAGASLAPALELEAAGHREHNPRRAGEVERPVGGLGLAPGGLWVPGGEGALARVLGVVHRRHLRWASLPLGEIAWRWEARGRVATLTGDGRVLLLELDGTRRSKTGLRGMRLSLLGPGDRWDLEHDRLLLGGETREARGAAREAALSLEALVEALSAEPVPALLVLGQGPRLAIDLAAAPCAALGSFARAAADVGQLPRWPPGVRER